MVIQPKLARESSTRSVSSLYDSCSSNDEQDHYPNRKRIRLSTKKSVSFDITKTEYIPTISNGDYTLEEKIATFYSHQEYQEFKENIKHLVNFLRYQKYPRSQKKCKIDFTKEDDVCVRGLECLADEFVSMHRKRIRQLSLIAVFSFQNLTTSHKGHYNNILSGNANSSFYNNYKSESIAKAYMTHSLRSQGIASHWGHFDAVDADMIHNDNNITSGSSSTTYRQTIS
jgi:hypothetical protein